MGSLTPSINNPSSEMITYKNTPLRDGDDQDQGLEHHYEFDDLVPADDEDGAGQGLAAAQGIHGSRRKSYSASISVAAFVGATKKKKEDEEALEIRKSIVTATHKGINFLRGLGVGWSLVLLDLTIGIPISLLLTHLNKVIISYLGYEKIMRCPSGILGSRIFFVVVNAILVVHWGLQMNEEEKIEGEIGYWGDVCTFLEGERERGERKVEEEVECQLLVESFGSPSSQVQRQRGLRKDESGRGEVGAEEMVPKIPSTVQRRVIRPAVGTGAGSVVPKTPSGLRKEVTAGVVNPDTQMDVKQNKTKPNKMTVGRKAGLRIKEEQSQRLVGEEDGVSGDGVESD